MLKVGDMDLLHNMVLDKQWSKNIYIEIYSHLECVLITALYFISASLLQVISALTDLKEQKSILVELLTMHTPGPVMRHNLTTSNR